MLKLGILSGLASLLILSTGSAQEVYRKVSSEKLEALLKELDISYRKVASKNEGIFYYHFKRNNCELRLHNYHGNDLWIDSVFPEKMPLEQINRWNTRTRFSRAVFIRDGSNETVSLESQIDCLGGVTDEIIKRFIRRFDGEVEQFSKFIAK